jgi:hypothetical protein
MEERKLLLSANDLQSLLIKGQSDGESVWGRWNANGPGTARLFYELGMGKNFHSLTSAKPGDFLKIFWTDQIGVKEFGHSVIFLGTRATPQGGVIRIWSSNLNVGYSEKEIPLGKIKRMLFSRLLNASALQFVSRLPKRDAYLASMLTNASTQEEMSIMVGDDQEPSGSLSIRAKPVQETEHPDLKSSTVLRERSADTVPPPDSVAPVLAPTSTAPENR